MAKKQTTASDLRVICADFAIVGDHLASGLNGRPHNIDATQRETYDRTAKKMGITLSTAGEIETAGLVLRNDAFTVAWLKAETGLEPLYVRECQCEKREATHA